MRLTFGVVGNQPPGGCVGESRPVRLCRVPHVALVWTILSFPHPYHVPKKYEVASNSGLTAEVPASGSVVCNFELDSK